MDSAGWTPVASGDIYCSPRCGFKCSKAGYDRAVAEGDALAARLGEGWEPCIWENGGWHYSVHRGETKVTANTTGSKLANEYDVTGYTAWIEPPGAIVGSCLTQFIERADTPEDAIGFAVQAARTHIARIEQALDHLREGTPHAD